MNKRCVIAYIGSVIGLLVLVWAISAFITLDPLAFVRTQSDRVSSVAVLALCAIAAVIPASRWHDDYII